MSKDTVTTEDTDLLLQKVELATKAGDMLIFNGPMMGMLNQMVGMFGMTTGVSIGMILPTKKQSNTRRFLVSLHSIINTALDDRLELADFTAKLAEEIKEIKAIVEEEKEQ